MNNKCCEECINVGRKGEWTGCCDMGCPCHTTPPDNWEAKWTRKFFQYQEIGAIEHSDEMIPFIRTLIDNAYHQGHADGLKEAVEALKSMTIEVVGNSAKTIDQVTAMLEALSLTNKEEPPNS